MQEDRFLEIIFTVIEESISFFCIYPLVVPSPHYGGALYSFEVKLYPEQLLKMNFCTWISLRNFGI